MALRKNTATINAQADAFAALFNGGTLQIRTGSQPASSNDAATGTLLQEITLPSPAFAAASGGVASKTGTWQSFVLATGAPGWARFISSSGDRRLDVSAGGPASGADLEADAAELTENGVGTVTTFTLTVPASA